jgi:hypothetical protein
MELCRNLGAFTLSNFPHHSHVSNNELLEKIDQWNSIFAEPPVTRKEHEYDWEDVTIPEGWLGMSLKIILSPTEFYGILFVEVTTWSRSILFQYDTAFSSNVLYPILDMYYVMGARNIIRFFSQSTTTQKKNCWIPHATFISVLYV